MADYKILFETLNEENKELKKRIEELEERLKTYTSTHRQKKYYEKNKEQIIEKTKEYNKNHKRIIDPEKIKEYNRKAYLKRKEKSQTE